MFVIYESDELRAATLPNVILLAWHLAPTASTIREVGAKMARHHEAHPEGVVIVNCICGGAPDDAARRAFREVGEKTVRSVAGVVLVFPEHGLRTALAKTVVLGIRAATRARFPIRVADSIAAIGSMVRTMLEGRVSQPPGSAEIETALRVLSGPCQRARVS